MSSCLCLAYTKFTKIFTTPKYSQLFVRRLVNAIIQNNSGHAKYLNQRFKMPIIPTKTTAIISVVFQRLSLRWARPHMPRVDSMFQQAKQNYSGLAGRKKTVRNFAYNTPMSIGQNQSFVWFERNYKHIFLYFYKRMSLYNKE